jgi:steroid 5-alpha reductase family enzyme
VIPDISGFLPAWTAATVLVFGAVTVLWAVSVRTRDVSTIDVFWGPAYLVAVVAAWWTSPTSEWAIPTMVLVGLWAGRLAIHLAPRLRDPEDRRYAEMRERRGPTFRWSSLVRVFWLQAVLVVVLGGPLIATVLAPGRPGTAAGLAAVVVLGGLVFEAVADAQLARFLRHSASEGQVLDTGLWRYSRHPNYFGEAVVWWGFGLWTAFALGTPLTLVVSALMTALLLRVSGVPLLEPHLESTRPGYAAYARRTSAFVPMPPSRSDGTADE